MQKRHTLAVGILAAVGLALFAPAQAPDGWYVVTGAKSGTTAYGDGGVTFVHSRTPGLFYQVSGLPVDLTGTGTSAVTQGANCVTIDPETGAIYVGTTGVSGFQVNLHEIYTTNPGAAAYNATLSRVHPVGTVNTSWASGMSACAILPSSDVLFTTYGMAPSGPSNGAPVGLYLKGSQTVVPAQVTWPAIKTMYLNALAVRRDGTKAYVADQVAAAGFDIYELDLTSQPYVATLLTNIPCLVCAMSLSADGSLLYVVGNMGTNNTFTVDVTPPYTVTPLGAAGYNGIASELASTEFAALARGTTYTVGRISANGTWTPLATPPASGWGFLTGVALLPALDPIGTPSVNQRTYEWQVRPSATGLASVGNSAFQLELQADGPASFGWVAFSFGALSSPLVIPQYNLFVWINSQQHIGNIYVTPSTTQNDLVQLPFPIPAFAGLSGLEFYVQSFHFFGAGIDASPGLEIVIQ